MLVATFGPSSGWVGKAITHDGGRFILDGFGPITARAVLDYDMRGQLDWAYAGLRDWVHQVEFAEGAAARTPAATAWSGQPPAEQELGIAGFVLSLVGFVFPIAWIVGLVLCWIAVRRARRENAPHTLAFVGLIISCIGTALSVVAMLAWFFLFAGAFAAFATTVPHLVV